MQEIIGLSVYSMTEKLNKKQLMYVVADAGVHIIKQPHRLIQIFDKRRNR